METLDIRIIFIIINIINNIVVDIINIFVIKEVISAAAAAI